jgi:hypothetical protein
VWEWLLHANRIAVTSAFAGTNNSDSNHDLFSDERPLKSSNSAAECATDISTNAPADAAADSAAKRHAHVDPDSRTKPLALARLQCGRPNQQLRVSALAVRLGW